MRQRGRSREYQWLRNLEFAVQFWGFWLSSKAKGYLFGLRDPRLVFRVEVQGAGAPSPPQPQAKEAPQILASEPKLFQTEHGSTRDMTTAHSIPKH